MKGIIDAHFENDTVSVHCRFEDGRDIQKLLRTDQFIDYLANSKETCSFHRIGQLPAGFVDGAMGESPNSFKAVISVPAGKRPLYYFGDSFLIAFPETVFFLEVVEKHLRSSQLFVNVDNVLYHYPFANVYTDGKICWGANRLGEFCTFSDLEKCPNLFYGSETNNDLYSPGTSVINKPEFCYQRGLIEALQDKDEFPVEWLVPCEGLGLREKFSDRVNSFLEN